MKKTFLLLALTAGLSTALLAQKNTTQNAPAQKTQKVKPSPEERAQKVSEYMTTELGLSADQQQKVSELNKAKAKQISEIKAKYNGDMKAAMPEIKPVKQQYHTNLKAILTPEQASKWEQIKQKKKEEIKQKKQSQSPLTEEDVD